MSSALIFSELLPEETISANDNQTTLAFPDFKVGPELQDVPVEEIERAYAGRTAPEAIRMYLAIMKGSRMGAGEGWFGPGE